MAGKGKTVEPTIEAEAVTQPQVEESQTTQTEVQTESTTQAIPDELKKQILEEAKVAALEEYKGMQRTLQREKDKSMELEQRLAQLQQQPASLDKEYFNLLEEVVSSQSPEYGEANPALQKIKGKIAQLELQERQKQEQAKYQKQYNDEFNKIRSKADDVGLDIEDERLWAVKDAFVMGHFDEAHKRLDRIIAKVTPKEEKVVNKEMDDLKAEVAKLKQLLGAQGGVLSSDTGTPAGANKTFTVEQITNMSTDEYAKLKPEIDEARRQGRIKR